MATVVAAAIPVALELTRDTGGGGAAPPVQGAPSSGQPSPTPPAAPTDPAPTAESPTVTALPSPSADVVPLTEMREVDDFEGWEQEPLTVAGKRHEAVLTASPCWLNDNYMVTFVVSRQFRVLEAAVGIADESPKGMPLRFTVLSDRKEVFTTTVGLGRTRPVKGGHQRLDPGVAAGQHHQRGAVPRRQPRRLYRAAGAPVSAGPST